MKHYVFAIVASISVAAGGCGYQSKSTLTSPTAAGVSALMGNWASASASVIPSAASCTDFKWNVSEQTASAAKGPFSASCAGGLKLAGTAQGTLSGSVISWSAVGTATAPVLPSCGFTLTGTAEVGTNSIRVPYSGDTCLGKVSGVEILNKT